MLPANGWLKLILNAALACLVVFIAIEVAIRAIAKRSKPNHARIGIKDARSLTTTTRGKQPTPHGLTASVVLSGTDTEQRAISY